MHKKYHLGRQPIPAGYQIYEGQLEIPGIHHRRANALAFSRGKGQSLELEQEPNNPHDPNAIKIIGVWRGWFLRHRRVLGYVPREVAARIAAVELFSTVRPRLLKTYAGTDGFVEIELQILGPKKQFKSYRSGENSCKRTYGPFGDGERSEEQ